MTGYHTPPGSHTDAAAIAVLSEVLSSEPSGRLYKSLIESKKASSVFGFNLQTKEPGYTMFVSELRKENSLDDVRNTMTETIENFAKTAPTKEEVERAKTSMLKDIDLALNDPNRVGLELSEWIAQGDWRLYFLTRDRLKKVTPEDVQRVANTYLKQANRTVGMFVPTDKPDRAEIPNVKDAEVLAMVKDYKGDAMMAQGEAFDPSPANIESRVKRMKVGGLDVAFLPKENRGDAVVANLILRFGDEKSLMNRADAAQFAGQLLQRGTAKHTRQQIQDEFDRLKAQVRVFGGATSVENFAKTAPTKEEVERAKTSMLKDIDLALNDPNRVGLELSEWIAQGDWRLYFLTRDRLKKVTPEDVQRVANTYLKQANRTVGMFVPTDKPDRAEIPNVKDAEVLAMVKDYKGDAMMAQGEAFDPSPANIESRVKRMKVGGLDVAFLPKENRGDAVVANLILRFGDEKSLMNRADAAQFAGQLLQRGTAKHTRQQIQDEFDRLKAQVRVFGGATSANVSIETTRQNLPAVLRLVGEILREPAFPQTEFDQLKLETLTQIESQKSEPTSIAFTELSRHFNIYPKGHPLYSGTIDEDIADIKAVTLNDVKKFYKDFYGASNGQMTVVGDFDEKEISALTQELFGNWKSPSSFTRIKGEYRAVAPLNKSFETPDKANAFFVARLNLKVRDDNPDYAALALGNYMLGGGFLNSRLAVRIRQKEGLSYGVGSQFNASSLDESGQFLANAIYAPENADKLEAAFKDELAKLLKDGFTAQEIEEAKKGFIQRGQLSRAQDRELSGRLNNYLFLNRTIAWDAELESKIQSLTAEQINQAMRKYLTPDNITIIKAGDFAKAKEKMKAVQ